MADGHRRTGRDAPDPLLADASVGLAVMEVQVLHFGHVALLSWMRATCWKCIVALGSGDRAGRPGHPFTFAQRKAMVDAVFGAGAFSFVSLNDIESTVTEDWTEYVERRMGSLSMASPTDYFCGSRHDAAWYEHAYARADGPGTREGPGVVWHGRDTGRRLRILEREGGDRPSGRQIRDLVELRDDEWKRQVPPVLWRYVDWHYPPSMRVALRGMEEPAGALHPVGTMFKGPGAAAPVTVLMDDGKWRPLRGIPDEKAEHARKSAARREED